MFIKSLIHQTFKKQDISEKKTLEGYYCFHTYLTQNIRSYNGKHKKLIPYCPSLFKLLCNIINDRFTDWNSKLLIDAALGYFVLPEDTNPNHEEADFIDDLYIVCYVLKEIKDHVSPQLITANWEGSEDILLSLTLFTRRPPQFLENFNLTYFERLVCRNINHLILQNIPVPIHNAWQN